MAPDGYVAECTSSICYSSVLSVPKEILRCLCSFDMSPYFRPTVTCSVFTHPREKYKLKEREEIWHKIEQIAKQNPQVQIVSLDLSLGQKI